MKLRKKSCTLNAKHNRNSVLLWKRNFHPFFRLALLKSYLHRIINTILICQASSIRPSSRIIINSVSESRQRKTSKHKIPAPRGFLLLRFQRTMVSEKAIQSMAQSQNSLVQSSSKLFQI